MRPTRTWVRGSRPPNCPAAALGGSASLGLPGWHSGFLRPYALAKPLSLIILQIRLRLAVMPRRASEAFILRAPYRPRLASCAASASGSMGSGGFGDFARERIEQQVERATPGISHCADTE